MRRLALVVGLAVLLGGCGSAAETAKNPQPSDSRPRVRQVNVGDAVVLAGVDDANGTGTLRMAVKVKNVVATAIGRGAFEKPRKGERFAAVRFVFKNMGATPYHDSPTFGAKVIDSAGHGYDPTVATVSAGPPFPRVMSLVRGQVRSGYIVFAVPRAAKIVSVQYALNAGYAPELGEWRVPPRAPARTPPTPRVG
ncbi:DUF4352 domain-containing protein [Actinoallomurus iriomotensis]|uniref:DUF4352 domain-containing protein n=1 Tax=Actinoallomurus iriomotensis TaxID=478107 RepID=A0A9W6VT78_9ACTN|nr:DUF4352 domain-containing protein [Actinoallomurus iriomotensis]GLY77346.1 hypothetical protein Airi01_056130 [Actinoallomurus iriomotensis]